jgi:AraC-like DNA-binding protein
MQLLSFDSGMVPAERRLATFQAGATDFMIQAVDGPENFAVSWHLLPLAEVNLVECAISPARYARTPAQIEADGQDRLAVLRMIEGAAGGTYDGVRVDIGSGDAMIWDLTRPFDIGADRPARYNIVTMPRYFVAEVLPSPRFACVLRNGPALQLAFDHVRRMIAHADQIPEESGLFQARAVRDLMAMAMLPAYDGMGGDRRDGPVLNRICDAIDAQPGRLHSMEEIAVLIGHSAEGVRAAVGRVGGLDLLVERRRLLAAYRRLGDPERSEPIGRIAEACGFPDPADFSRRFRQAFHCSPRDLRNFQLGRLPWWAGGYHVESNYGALLAEREGSQAAQDPLVTS